MNAKLLRLNPLGLPSPALATVAQAREGEALSVRLDHGDAPVLGHLAAVPALEPGDTVLVTAVSGGMVVMGRLRAPGEAPAALLQSTSAGITVDGGRSLTLRAGVAQVELHADGRVLVDGREIYAFADGRLCLQGATIELN